MDDRRLHLRLRQRRKFALRLSSGEILYLWTYDLSFGGVQVLSENPADTGVRFVAYLSVFDRSRDRYTWIEVEVKTIHVIYDGTAACYRIGFQFLNFKEEGQALLEQDLEERLGRLHRP